MWPDVVPWCIFAATAGVMVYITERDKKREREDAAPVDSFRDWKPLDFKIVSFDYEAIEKRVLAREFCEHGRLMTDDCLGCAMLRQG